LVHLDVDQDKNFGIKDIPQDWKQAFLEAGLD